jgi:hypothetical protein
MIVTAGPFTMEGRTAISEFFDNVSVVAASRINALEPKDTSYTSSCLYSKSLVKGSCDCLWKIKKWDLKIL